MQIRLCQEPEEWNQAVLGLGGTLYHSWQWGDLRRRLGWIPWRVLAQEDGGRRAAVQILERTVPVWGASVMYAVRGIAYRRGDTEALCDLVGWLREFLRERRAIFLRLDPEIPDTDASSKEALKAVGLSLLSDQWTAWNLPRTIMTIDITPPDDRLLLNMRPKHRQHIRTARKKGLEIEAGTDAQHLRDFYDLLLKTGERKGFPIHDFDYFQQLWRSFSSDGASLLLLARHEKACACGLLCVRFGKGCYALYGGMDWTLRDLHVNEAVHWQAILWAKRNGCKCFNLIAAGTTFPPQEGSPLYGLYWFKKGLGAELQYYCGYLDLVNQSTRYELFRLVEKQVAGRFYRIIADIASRIRSFTRFGA